MTPTNSLAAGRGAAEGGGVTERCTAQIWTRDTYRRTERGKSGFEMHYDREQCSRRATKDGRCWQHPRNLGFMDYPWP